METWDLIVMGGGPAGASAALVAGGNGLRTCLLEASAVLGGQLHWADAPIVDLLGHPSASGAALASGFQDQLRAAGVEIQTRTRVVALEENPRLLEAQLSTGVRVGARRVLLATGLRRRTLGVPGEAFAEQRLSPRRDAGLFRGRRVIVIGGGDEAADTARGLAQAGAEVLLLARSSLRARPLFAAPVLAQPGVSILEGGDIARIHSTELGGVRVELADGRAFEADVCFIRIGAEPELPRLGFSLERHEDGRLRVDRGGRTTHPWVFAAGDLVHPRGERYVSAAMGSGAVAARAIEASLRPARGLSAGEKDRS